MKVTSSTSATDSYNAAASETAVNDINSTSNVEFSSEVDATHDGYPNVIDDTLPHVHIIPSETCVSTRLTSSVTTLNNNTSEKTDSLSAVLQVTQDKDEALPEYLKLLLEGTGTCGDSCSAYVKPDWLDMERFRRGQEFQKNYSFGIMYSQMVSLMILFAFQGGLEPLIYSGKSGSPFKAFKRYLSTATRVKTWYEGDIWKEDNIGHKNLKIVRGMHENIRKRLTLTPKEELANKLTLEDEEETNPMWTTFHEDIKEDFKSSCPVLQSPLHGEKQVYVNQTDMVVTQFGFIGLVLLFPKMFGIHGASADDLDGFSHYWRTIGYLLGIEDRFNLCNGSLEVVMKRCQDLLDLWVKPSLGKISRDWIHMSRCMVEGISYYVAGTTFEVVLLYLCTVINIQAPRLAASLTFAQRMIFGYTLFLFAYILRLPGMWTFHNWLINLAIKRAQSNSPERTRELEGKVYPYQTQPRLVCTRM